MWMYGEKQINSHDDLLPECTDIVYVITYTNGKKYIGKKAVRAKRKCPPLKGKKRNRIILKNLPFKDYEGSHDVEGLEIDSKVIWYQCRTRKASTYLECALLFYYNAIFDDNYINKNIAGKFFDTDLDGMLNSEY